MLLLSHILLQSLAQASSRRQEGENPQEDLQGLCPQEHLKSRQWI